MRTALIWIQGGKVIDGYVTGDPTYDAAAPGVAHEVERGHSVVEFLRSGHWQFRSVAPAAEAGKGDQFRMVVVLEEAR
jgi:hypothetical protein